MSAPAGLCGSCGMPMQWTGGPGLDLFVRCRYCADLFEVDGVGTELADESREGREAVMPDGRPIRSIDSILADSEDPLRFAGGR